MKALRLWFGDYEQYYDSESIGFFEGDTLKMNDELEKLYPKILEEVSILWKNIHQESQLYGNYDSFDDKQFPPNTWKKIVIKVWGLYNSKTSSYFPEIYKFVQSNPNITSCYITKTLPGSIIKPHCGETNGIIRFHLGLNIPSHSGNLCSIKLQNQIKDWENGKAFGFIDALQHEVWNKTNGERYILIVDVIRDEFKTKKNYISSRIITTQFIFASLSMIFPQRYLGLIPTWFLTLSSYILYLPIIIFTFLNNKFQFIKF